LKGEEMKRFINFTSFIALVSIIVMSCNAPIQPGAAGDGEGEQEQQPTTDETPTLETIDLAGPLMEVGSTYRYVDGTLLVAVPGGKFIMGGDKEDNPVHEVTVSDFWIYSTKVTNAQYAGCVAAGHCTPPDPDNNPIYKDYKFINFPVTGVTHTQASEYCEYVNGRLPTEAEWEKTARGPDGNIFPWGDGAPACDLLNFQSCVGKTTKVTEYKNGISYYSALDMAGNAREWVADWYAPDYYNSSVGENPLGPDFGEKRSVRGSSYQDGSESVFPSNRFSLDPTLTLPDLGFRCVVEEPVHFAPACEILAYNGLDINGQPDNCMTQVDCNTVSVTQNALCSGTYLPYTIVTFKVDNTPPDNWTFDAPGCTLLSGETSKFECKPGEVGPLIATGSCTVNENSCASACPQGYIQDGNTCIWGGTPDTLTGTACLPGMTYDTNTQCCSANPGTANTLPLCPAGTTPVDGVCVGSPSGELSTVNENVLFNSCEPPKDRPEDDPGGDPSGCTVPKDPGCSYPYAWDGQCGCTCTWGEPSKCAGYIP